MRRAKSDKHFSPTTFERRWDKNGKRHLLFSLTYSIAVHTAFYRSYSVEASNPLTSFVDFRFKDSLFEENRIGAIHIFRFYETDFS